LKNDRSNGVAFLLNHSDLSFTNWHGDQHGRIVTADFSTREESIRIVKIYAPQSGHPTRERSKIFNSLYVYIHSTHPTILTGDFNCVENPMLDRHPPSNRKDNTLALRELCETFRLRDTFRAAHGDARLFTRRQANLQSRIDRFYASDTITPQSEQTLPGLASDHDLVVLQIKNITIPTRGTGRWKNNTSIYADTLFQNHFKHKWSQWRTLQSFLFPTKADWWIQTKTRVKNLLKQHARIKLTRDKKRENHLRKTVENLCQQIHENPSLLFLYHQAKTEWN